jgi:hypothetical protein
MFPEGVSQAPWGAPTSLRAGWVKSLRDPREAHNVPFFFKQWGGRTPKAGGRELDGRFWDGMPRVAAGEGGGEVQSQIPMPSPHGNPYLLHGAQPSVRMRERAPPELAELAGDDASPEP